MTLLNKEKISSLPNTLPKKNNQREASFGLKLRKYLDANPLISSSMELKQSTTNSIPFSCLGEEQLAYGMRIKSDKGTLIRVQGVSGEPDYVYLRNAPAFVIIKYPTSFHLIDIETFALESKRSKRRSLTVDRARAISTISV